MEPLVLDFWNFKPILFKIKLLASYVISALNFEGASKFIRLGQLSVFNTIWLRISLKAHYELQSI